MFSGKDDLDDKKQIRVKHRDHLAVESRQPQRPLARTWPELHCHFNPNNSPIYLSDCIFRCYQGVEICPLKYRHKVFRTASVVLPATVGVSRSTFCHNDSHMGSPGENNACLSWDSNWKVQLNNKSSFVYHHFLFHRQIKWFTQSCLCESITLL